MSRMVPAGEARVSKAVRPGPRHYRTLAFSFQSNYCVYEVAVKDDKAKIHGKSRRLILTTAYVGSALQRFLKAAVLVGE